REIVRWTVAHNRIPEMTLSYALVRAGCLGGVALDMRAMGRQAGRKVAALLAGRPVRSLPLEAAHEYGIVFNYRRAQALGIDLPPTLLWAADEVFAEP
uniref:ABC transporter substrate binding protein n=1 Tax=Sulfurivirga sp. TaxID=2614236 RepID=UPI0025EB8293